jgi:AcrR family transcriptional regulator
MAVYTHFGGMPAVVRAIIQEGFARLAAELATVERTDDPVADSVALSLAYRRAAHRNPHLYRVMFGATGFELTAEDRQIGLYTLRVACDQVVRCVAAGRYRDVDPWVLTRQGWSLIHGLVSLELAGFYADLPTAGAELRRHFENFAVGAGDTAGKAQESVARAFDASRRYSGSGRGDS